MYGIVNGNPDVKHLRSYYNPDYFYKNENAYTVEYV